MIVKMQPGFEREYEFVPQAIISRSPAFLSNRGISFRTDVDDLNIFQVAELSFNSSFFGREVPFAFMHHEGTPENETEVYLPSTIPLSNISEILRLILADLDLPFEAVSWQRRMEETAL